MTGTIFDDLAGRWHHLADHLPGHHDDGHPAAGHDHQEETMPDLAKLAADIKDHVQQGTDWLTQVVEQHVPQLLAAAERYQASPIVQALEGVVLTPEIEAEIAGIIRRFAALVPQPQVASQPPADAAAPAGTDAAR